jgi:hypothetical protein
MFVTSEKTGMDLKIYRKYIAYPMDFYYFSISDMDCFVDMGQNEKNAITELIRIDLFSQVWSPVRISMS